MKTIINKSIFLVTIIGILLITNGCSKDVGKYKEISNNGSCSCASGMDIAFLVDYTASMRSAISDIQNSITTIADDIEIKSSGDYRLSLSIFDENSVLPNYYNQSDYVSLPADQKIEISHTSAPTQYLTVMEKFGTANKSTFITQLNKLNNSMSLGYGVEDPEPGDLLIDEIINRNFAGNWRNTNILRLLIILTDDNAGGDNDILDPSDNVFLEHLATTANAKNIKCVLVTSLNPGDSNYEVHLINNNNGLAFTDVDFANISASVSQIFEDLCD
jgi:hypothetical protein